MISCKSQEDLLCYLFRLTAERDLITSKTLAIHGVKWKNPRVMLGENEKVGLMLSNSHVICSKSRLAHHRIAFLRSFAANVKVKVMIHFVWLSRFKTVCSSLSYLDICKKGEALFIFSNSTVFDGFLLRSVLHQMEHGTFKTRVNIE